MTVSEYVDALPEERRAAFKRLRKAVRDNLPAGFKEVVAGTTVAYVVPHSRYPAGYHCDPASPLPFLNLGSNKGGLVLYHMGLYADAGLLRWFTDAYVGAVGRPLDMGKSCIRFRRPDEIPFTLVGELAAKIGVDDWIARYEANLRPRLE